MSNWLTVIIVLLIIIILVDGFRRNAARRNQLGISPSLKKRQKEPSSDTDSATEKFNNEFPNGGARVIGHREGNKPSAARQKKPSAKEAREATRREEAAKRKPEQAHLDLEKSVPILMNSVASEPNDADNSSASNERIEPTFSARDSFDDADDLVELSDNQIPEDEPLDDESDDYADEAYPDEEDYDDEDDDYEDDDLEDDDLEDDEPDEQAQSQTQPEEVFIINIMAAKGQYFNGNDLLDATLKCGLRYGSMDIFHRYSNTKGEGTLLFSMANMVKPGTFDLDAMDDFETPGVTLFMTLPIEADSMKSFELMADTANILAEVLSGELKDEQRSAMTRQTIEHCRQRISDFERKKLFNRSR